jgi:NAD-dependent dihydropyrimidine dehydrogenase PreA subunit
MALYLVMLLALALGVGLLLERRAFCSYVCPVGHLLGLYAHCSILKWRAADASVCSTCPGKDCVAKSRRLGILRRSCTSGLYPPAIRDNRDCLLCTQCLKVCPQDNLRLAVGAPWSDLRQPLGLTGAQLAFLAIVSGFVVFEILSEWDPSSAALEWLPYRVAGALGLAGLTADLAAAGVMFLLLPAALFLAVAGCAWLATRTPVADGAKAFALLLLPTLSGAQVIKAILKTTGHLPYWKVALADPVGIESARAIQAGTLAFDPAIAGWMTAAITVAAALILAVALVVTVRLAQTSPWITRLPRAARLVLVAGTAAYWAVYAVTIALWRF